MTEEKFSKEIEKMKSGIISEQVKNKNLSVIVLGASGHAEFTSKVLMNDFGVKVDGYALDEEYYKSDQTYLGLPIYNFDELVKNPDKYAFVNGISWSGGRGNFHRVKRFINDKSILRYDVASRVAKISWEYVFENKHKFWETYNLLEDDFSKKTMLAYLGAQITQNPEYIQDFVSPDEEYFNDITRNSTGDGGYVDCGAWIGDTVGAFIKFVDGEYKKIFAFEPDPKNFVKLEQFIQNKGYKNVTLLNCGVWSEKTRLHFDCRGDFGSSFSESGKVTVNVDSIDNVVADTPINLIKMDVEGSELHALQGAKKTLNNFQPALAVSVYHKADDLIVIPQFIKSIYKNCKFYLRKHRGIYLHSLDLYVIPN